ncbi:MAG: MFS transporter [Planctomycetes bacterium]|nr:MFS transporter [Planctomycetota bacterium]
MSDASPALSATSFGDDQRSTWACLFSAPVLIAALGYFVDIYDLVLFGIVRKASLIELRVPEAALLDVGGQLLNMQMIGMLIGGLLWGAIGDRRGRITTLLGSILLYSVANLLNGMVTTIGQYEVLRLVAGIGLAGELGAGITLVVESLPRGKRGYGTMMVSGIGVSGAILGFFIASSFGWRNAYYIGGAMGLALLGLRVFAHESGMFARLVAAGGDEGIARGNVFALFTNASRLGRFLTCIAIGLPLWYVVGILVTFSPELAKALGVSGPIDAGRSLMLAYLGLVVGDFGSGLISQWWRSRKKAIAVFMGLTAVTCAAYFALRGVDSTTFYALILVLGVFVGYWALFVTVAAEQFGTNLRATVASNVPNFVRGALVPMIIMFKALKDGWGALGAAAAVGVLVFAIAAVALWFMRETFNRDLDYVE